MTVLQVQNRVGRDLSPVAEPERLASQPMPLARSSVASWCLDSRERQIVQLVSIGLSNKEIGCLLALSHHTVRNALVVIMRKAGVDNRVVLAVDWALQTR